MSAVPDLRVLTAEAKACTVCSASLPAGPKPVFSVSPEAKILLIGQAPGRKVHETGIPFDDPSGDRLRDWLGVDKQPFYDPTQIAIMPMGFCYPGTGKSGDLPPRPECAPLWHPPFLQAMSSIQLTVLIGQYAQAYYLGATAKPTLTETVKNWETYWPRVLPLPHPSPRNNIWLKKNAWFEREVIPILQARVQTILGRL